MQKFLRYLSLLRAIPSGRSVFLRREYDRLRGPIGAAARYYRRRVLTRTRIVAVVGSLGKTTTTHAVRAALDTPDRPFSYSNYGSSLAHNLLRIRPWDPRAVLEVGVGGPGQMEYYRRMIDPDLVVVTSIASDHNRSFPTLEDTREEKVIMVRSMPESATVLLNGDDPHVLWMATQTRARVITFGLGPTNDVRAIGLRHDRNLGIGFDVELDGVTHSIESRLIGEHMVYPLLAAITIAHLEGLDPASVRARLSRLEPVHSRMELVQLADGTRILDDSFKSSIESIHAAFDTFAKLDGGRKIVVLGNAEEPVGPQGPLYRDLGERLAGFADRVICIGGNNLTSVRAGATRAGMPRESVVFVGSSYEDGVKALSQIRQPGDILLVKGTSTQRLRRVVLALEGREVSCNVKYCAVKVRECDSCPLLTARPAIFDNPVVQRYIGS
jgi:UDP-N-acetylmuramoyl-tripeptide--D-alanyl-D-alanine ligase